MKGGLLHYAGQFLREIVFGLEDSLVSTLGVVVGVAAGTNSSFVVVVTGSVLIVVEALSMSAGSYLSSKSVQEAFEHRTRQDKSRMLQERFSDELSIHDILTQKGFKQKDVDRIAHVLGKERALWLKEVERCEFRFAPAISSSPAISGLTMGFFYLVGGLIPISAFFFFPLYEAVLIALVATGASLFLLGVMKAKVVGGYALKSGFEMTAISLTAAVLGYGIGIFVSALFPISDLGL